MTNDLDWRAVVDDMLTFAHMVASDDPRESINRLINWHVAVALDPAVSSDAAALVESERERCARICDTTPPYPFRPSIEAAHAIRRGTK